MAYSIDEIKGLVSIVDILTWYGGDVPYYGGSELSMCCPFHGESNPSSSVNVDKGLFFCHVCEMGGDTIKIVQQAEQFETVREAIDFIANEILPSVVTG